MNLTLWKEFLDDHRDIDVSSLVVQPDLAPEIWYNKQLDDEVRSKLLEIANKFFDDLDLDNLFGKDVKIDDILLTGSLASYNWSKYSICSRFSRKTRFYGCILSIKRWLVSKP